MVAAAATGPPAWRSGPSEITGITWNDREKAADQEYRPVTGGDPERPGSLVELRMPS